MTAIHVTNQHQLDTAVLDARTHGSDELSITSRHGVWLDVDHKGIVITVEKANVNALAGSTILAGHGAHIHAGRDANVIAYPGSLVHAQNGSHVSVTPGATVICYGNEVHVVKLSPDAVVVGSGVAIKHA